MKNIQLKYIIQALMHEHAKIIDEIQGLENTKNEEQQIKISHIKEDINSLVDTEYAALGVYVDCAEREVREEFNRLEMGLRNLSDTMDATNIRQLGNSIKENLQLEERVFRALQQEYEMTGS